MAPHPLPIPYPLATAPDAVQQDTRKPKPFHPRLAIIAILIG
jgi:hypothetical protein